MDERTAEESGKRLDAWLAANEPLLSRARWQQLIDEGRVTVNGTRVKRNYKLRVGDRTEWTIPEPVDAEPQPEDIPLDIVYEDSHIIVINKPAGLVVHPAAGNETGTLVNALLHHCNDLAGIGGEKRPGIVHRLDKDTSGLMVVAKTEQAMRALSAQFKKHTTEKYYLALVWGTPERKHDRIETTIGRHPVHRKKMAADVRNGRAAISRYELMESHRCGSLLKVKIETGRTHQIRVHMQYIKHAIIGDAVYGRPRFDHVKAPRQMLHAVELSLDHPESGERMTFTTAMPEDMKTVLETLRAE